VNLKTKKMKKTGIVLSILVVLVLIAGIGVIIYDPGVRSALIKPTGVPQRKLPSGYTTTVFIENVTVIPMDSERVLEGYSVVIENGLIADMGNSEEVEIPVDTHIVDGEGRYLIPGLSDMHVHMFGAENDLLLHLANGVTTIRTMGGGPPVILKWRDEINAGSRIGSTIWAWWPSIDDTLGQYSDSESMAEFSSRGGVRFVHTPEEAEALVAEMAALGVDGIKAHDIRSPEVYMALLKSANDHGLLFDSHLPMGSLDCWDCSRDMEVPAVAHIEELIKIERGSDEVLRQMAQMIADDGIWVTTTLYLMRSIAEQGADLEGAQAAVLPEAIYVHPDIFADRGWALESNYYSYVGSQDF
jgi:hypothetical protein